MEHNYNNLHLEGDYELQKKMVHNKEKVKHSQNLLGNLVGAFLTLAIGATVMSAVTSNLRKQGVI
jgi:hypothetical protein